MGKRKREGISLLTGPGGISAQPEHARARPRDKRPSQPTEGGNDAGTAPWVWAHVPARRGNGVRGVVTGGCRRGKSSAGWRNAPSLNPKMRRGLSVLPVC
jgi:hypothetical protein